MPEVKTIKFKDPTPKQDEVYRSTLEYPSVLMVGGVGSGKSSCLAILGIRESITFPGNQGMFIRRTLQELMETTHQSFLEECPTEFIVRSSRDESGGMNYWLRPIEWDGSGGQLSLVQFRSATHAGRQDPNKFKSLNLGWVALEEASELEEGLYLMLLSRLRRDNSRRIAVLATNPPNPEHWMEKYWNLKDHGVGRKTGYFSTLSKTTDNPHLPADYVQRLLDQWPASWVYRYMDGNVGFLIEGDPVFEQIFKPSIHVQTFDAERFFPLVRSWDIGYGRTPAVSWHQFVPVGNGQVRWHILDEMMWNNPTSLADFYVRALLRQQEIFGLEWESRDVYDPAGAAKDVQTNQSAIEVLREVVRQYGINSNFDCAADRLRNSIVYRIGMVQSWMTIPASGEPRMIIHPRCQLIIGGFQGGYQYQKDRPTGEKIAVPIKNHWSHLQDTVQYAGVNMLDYDKMIMNPSFKSAGLKMKGGLSHSSEFSGGGKPKTKIVRTV